MLNFYSQAEYEPSFSDTCPEVDSEVTSGVVSLEVTGSMPEPTEQNTPICHDDEISPTPLTEGFLLRHYVCIYREALKKFYRELHLLEGPVKEK